MTEVEINTSLVPLVPMKTLSQGDLFLKDGSLCQFGFCKDKYTSFYHMFPMRSMVGGAACGDQMVIPLKKIKIDVEV